MRKLLLAGLLASPFPVLAAPPVASGAPAAQPIPRTVFIASMDSEYKAIDANHDGILTQAEIEAYERGRAQAAAARQAAAIFAQLDTDHNGQLSVAEFSRRATNTPVNVNTAPFLAKMDLNHDGKVTLVEYRTATQANFDRLDTDRDGVVSVQEMRAGKVIK